MLLWFVVGSGIVVHQVFRSPAVDYRLVAAGSLVPIADGVTGGPALLHTLVAPVAVLGLVMVTTRGRRLRQRRLLGVPIGMFLHLVLDGTWARARQFWWPAFGTGFEPGRLSEWSRGWLGMGMEVVAGAVLVVAYRRFGLDDPGARSRFLRTGRLSGAPAR